MKRKTIQTYCKQEAEGWIHLPEVVEAAFPQSEWPHAYCFLRQKDGIQLIASVEDMGRITAIHISVSSVRSMQPDMTDEESVYYLMDVIPEVVKTFFGERLFAKAPDQPHKLFNKHYFSMLEENE